VLPLPHAGTPKVKKEKTRSRYGACPRLAKAIAKTNCWQLLYVGHLYRLLRLPLCSTYERVGFNQVRPHDQRRTISREEFPPPEVVVVIGQCHDCRSLIEKHR